MFGVDDRGLDKVDRAILGALCEQFRGGPVGLSTLAISVGEQTETVEDVYEPFLIQQGLLARTPRGRVAMPAAYEHLGLTAPRRHTARAASSTDGQPAGRCSARKAIVLDQAALAAASSWNIAASWLSKAWPAASTLSTRFALPSIAFASASTPSPGM